MDAKETLEKLFAYYGRLSADAKKLEQERARVWLQLHEASAVATAAGVAAPSAAPVTEPSPLLPLEAPLG